MTATTVVAMPNAYLLRILFDPAASAGREVGKFAGEIRAGKP